MSELPAGWVTANLGEVAEFEMGQAPPGALCNKEGHGTVFVKAGEFGVDYPLVREWTTQPLKFAHRGDVLICVVGATSGKLNLGIDCAIGRSVAAIRPSASVSQKIVYRQLQLQVAQLRADSSGTAQGVISKQMLADIQLVLPPVNEQTRIANQLDTLLARVQACNDRFDAIPALLKRFRQTVLLTAHAGDLTEDWRVKHGHELVEVTTLGSVLKVSSGNFLPAKDMAQNGKIPVFGGNGINGYHDHGNVQEKTLVIGRVGFYCGSIHMTPNSAWVTDNALIVRHDPNQTNREYLHYALKAVDLRVNDSSTAQPVISGQKIYPLSLRVPRVAEQLEIVRRVEALFALADRIEASLTAARTQAQRLTPLVLAKAFRGELVPQDPSDEPACAPLARIASSNTTMAGENKQNVPVALMKRAQAAIIL